MFAQLTSCELTALTWNLNLVLAKQADLGGRAVWGGGVWPLACWDCAFESRREVWMFVSCECFVLSGAGVRVRLITHPEESYRLWCVHLV